MGGAAETPPRLVRTAFWPDDTMTNEERTETIVAHPDDWGQFFHIYGLPPLKVKPDDDGSETIVYRNGSKSADHAHVGTVLWNTYAIVREHLEQLLANKALPAGLHHSLHKLKSQYDAAPPVAIFPHGFENEAMWNAYYDPYYHEQVYGWYIDKNGKKQYVVRSGEIVSHEAGHDILGRLWPELFDMPNLEPGGFHEGFGDSIAKIMRLLRNPAARNEVITQARGDLHNAEGLRKLAEHFGHDIGVKYGDATDQGLRDMGADIGLPSRSTERGMPKAEREVHAYGHVFASTGYDILSDAYSHILQARGKFACPDDALRDITQSYWRILLASIATAKEKKGIPGFSTIATEMYKNAAALAPSLQDNVPWQELIQTQFERHGIKVQTATTARLRTVTQNLEPMHVDTSIPRISRTMDHIERMQKLKGTKGFHYERTVQDRTMDTCRGQKACKAKPQRAICPLKSDAGITKRKPKKHRRK